MHSHSTMSSASTVARERSSHGRVRTRAEADDDVPEHLKCSVCLDAPCGRIEQCASGEHKKHPRDEHPVLAGTAPGAHRTSPRVLWFLFAPQCWRTVDSAAVYCSAEGARMGVLTAPDGTRGSEARLSLFRPQTHSCCHVYVTQAI